MTGRDLVSASLRLLGVLASGESLASDMATDGLSALNRLISSWSTEDLLVFGTTQESPITLVGGQASYTLGAGGTLTNRPMEIEKAVIRDVSMDYPVRLLSLDEFVDIPNKSVSSVYPNSLYDDGGYPQRTITLFPTPSGGKSLILWTNRALTSIATLDTAISLPPGYERALIYNMAIDISPEYGKMPSEVIAGVALESKSAIKRSNYKPNYLRCDSGVVGRGHFNINTGDYNR